MEKSPCDWICYIAAKNHNLFMKWNEREKKENAVRLIVHSLTHRGEMWRGGRGREVKEWRGGAALLCRLIAGQDGMTIHILLTLANKKGLLLTVIRTRGLVETRWCAAAEARSQVITWSSALTLCASYMSPPPLPPPPPPTPPLLSHTRSLITTPCPLLHVVYKGVPKQFP